MTKGSWEGVQKTEYFADVICGWSQREGEREREGGGGIGMRKIDLLAAFSKVNARREQGSKEARKGGRIPALPMSP